MSNVPTTMKGLILNNDNTLTLNTKLPYPSPVHGSATIKVLYTTVNPNFVEQLRAGPNSHAFTLPTPCVPGGGVVGRVVATGPDAVKLKVGQLVAVDINVRARDDADVYILWGAFDGITEESKKLARDAWRDGALAEYVRAPLENIFVLDEELLCGKPEDGGLGYEIKDVVHLWPHNVAYGALRRLQIQAGETVVITPSTGMVSGACVSTAVAMGASVIATGRSASALARLKSVFPTIRTAQVSGDLQADSAAIATAAKGKPIDAVLEMGPPASTDSKTVTACMMAVKQNGRIVLGGARGDAAIPLPWQIITYKNLSLRGSLMYERQHVYDVIRLAETGTLKLGEANGFKVQGPYSLEDWDKAAEETRKNTGFGNMTLISP